MFFADLVAALIVALIFSVILGALMGWERPERTGVWPSVLFLFLVLFLATWFIGTLVEPFGSPMWGIYWLPFLVIGLIITLILAATVPPRRPRTYREAKIQAQNAYEAQTALGTFFWILFVAMIIALAVRYTA